MNCSSCQKPKDKVFPKESSLLPGIKLYLCQTCIDAKYEPRWTIILAYHQGGMNAVSAFINKNLYFGDKILVEELLP